MSQRTCTRHRSLGPCYISIGIRRQCQHKTGPWYLLTILMRSGTWFGLWDESRNCLSFTFQNSQNPKCFRQWRAGWSGGPGAGVVGTGMVFPGITRSLIYVEVLRVTDIVQTSGVVYPASRRRLSRGTCIGNDSIQELRPSLSHAARWDQRMTP